VEQRGLGVDGDVLPRSTVDLFVLHGYHYCLQATTTRLLHNEKNSLHDNNGYCMCTLLTHTRMYMYTCYIQEERIPLKHTCTHVLCMHVTYTCTRLEDFTHMGYTNLVEGANYSIIS
jgi:hypothetical protein